AMVAAGLGLTLMSDLGRSFLPSQGVSTHRLRVPVRRQILVGYDEPSRARPAVTVFRDSVLRAAEKVGLSRTGIPATGGRPSMAVARVAR
ncbi:MAG: hypothetical protein ABIS35_02665, partial [Terracoccus sp.]